jgi:hypothetical protein
MRVSCRRMHARVHTAQLAHPACSCTPCASSDHNRVCNGTGQRGPSRKLQRAMPQAAKHQGPGQRQASRMMERTRASKKRGPKTGATKRYQNKAKRTRDSTLRHSQKLNVFWCHGAVPLLGPAKRPDGAPILEHLTAANAAVGTAAEPSPAAVGTAAAQPSSRRHSSRAQHNPAQQPSPELGP